MKKLSLSFAIFFIIAMACSGVWHTWNTRKVIEETIKEDVESQLQDMAVNTSWYYTEWLENKIMPSCFKNQKT